MGDDPRIARHVGDSVFAADEVAPAQSAVEDVVKAAGFVLVAADGVGDLFRRVFAEVVVLAEHRAESAHLPHQPLDGVGASAEVLGDEAAGFVGEVKQDGAGFKDGEGRSVVGGFVVDDGGDAVVGRDGEEVGPELLAFADVDGDDVVGESGFFQEDGDFVAVGGGPVVEVNHCGGGRFRGKGGWEWEWEEIIIARKN